MNYLANIETDCILDTMYQHMLSRIEEQLPAMQRATDNFNKTQSQYMDNMLTVSHHTPIRNLRQILAEVKKSSIAIGEAKYAISRKRLDIESLTLQLAECTDDIMCRRIKLDISEREWQIELILDNIKGAIRKISNYVAQYQSISDTFHLGEFTEADFEAEEEKYHITKAFEQGLNAARAHGGFIDEGNQIYFSQLGINGTVAQVEVANYLMRESMMLSSCDANNHKKEISEPTHSMQLEFLDRMAEKFKGCSKKYAIWKGMSDTKIDDALV